jgi:hypothetical protein
VTLLDLPARDLLQLSDQAGDCRAQLAGGLIEATGTNPKVLADEYKRAAEEGGGTVRDAVRSMELDGRVLGEHEIKGVEMFETRTKELRAHAAAYQKQLDQAAQPLSLEARADALEHPTRRYLLAKEKGLADDREKWEAQDSLALESGRDLLADVAAADEQRELTASLKVLDSALQDGMRQGLRDGTYTRALDVAVSDARSKKISLAAGPSTGVRTLVADTPFDQAQRLVALEGGSALDGAAILDAMGRLENGTVALDAPGDPLPLVKLKPGVDVEANKAHRLQRVKAVRSTTASTAPRASSPRTCGKRAKATTSSPGMSSASANG